MKRIDVKEQASIIFGHAKSLATRLKRMNLSPLSAIMLAGLSIMTLATGFFALHAVFGRPGSEESESAPDWRPPTLAIVALSRPTLASADVESLSRPIFSKSRKPTPKSAAPATTNDQTASVAASLTAIVLEKKTARAFFVPANAPEGAWKKIGDIIDSWTVTDITPVEVALENGGQKTRVKLYANVPAVTHPADVPSAQSEGSPGSPKQ